MVLLLDIENTHLFVGVAQEDTIQTRIALSSDTGRTADEYAVLLRSALDLRGVAVENIKGAILSSVVWSMTKTLSDAVHRLTGLTPMVVGPGVRTGLNITIDNPAQLGSDLVINGVAAAARYPVPLILFTMNTITAVSVLDSRGSYIGGALIPGVGCSMECMTACTTQLPRAVVPEVSRKVIGRNTVDCMKSGVVFGNAAMVDGMIDRVEKELGAPVTVVATGSYAEAVIPHCEREIEIAPDLAMEGLLLIYRRNQTPG
jgi:type III pantothenate kinase